MHRLASPRSKYTEDDPPDVDYVLTVAEESRARGRNCQTRAHFPALGCVKPSGRRYLFADTFRIEAVSFIKSIEI